MLSVLGRTVDRCTLENNTLLHIDLPVVAEEYNPNIYSYTYADTEQITPPTWLLVTATVGVLLIILLVIAIIIIILRIRRLSKQRPPVTSEMDRFHDNDESHGTDVWFMSNGFTTANFVVRCKEIICSNVMAMTVTDVWCNCVAIYNLYAWYVTATQMQINDGWYI